MITESINMRWMIRRDYTEVIDIENKSFASPMVKSEVVSCLNDVNSIGLVAESWQGDVIGFCLYRLDKAKLEIIRIAVTPEHRRCGVGYAIIDRLISKLENQRRTHIDVVVSLEFTAALAFFRRAGFIAVSVTGDLVRMRYAKDPDLTRWSGK